MSTELTNPLLDVIRRASENKVQGPLGKLKQRFQNCSDEIYVLADASGSMADVIGSSGLSKHEHLKVAVRDILLLHPTINIVEFASYARAIKCVADLREPAGRTDLAAGIQFIRVRRPKRTIIVSDGLPNNEQAALAEIDQLTGSVDTIYCGPDSHPAVEFLRKLSRHTGGRSFVWDGCKEALETTIRAFLPAPGQ